MTCVVVTNAVAPQSLRTDELTAIHLEKNVSGIVIQNKRISNLRLTQLMPDSCWANIIIMAMTSGCLRVELTNISFKVTFGTSFMLS